MIWGCKVFKGVFFRVRDPFTWGGVRWGRIILCFVHEIEQFKQRFGARNDGLQYLWAP